MHLVILFGSTLLVAALLSELARRSILSTTILFLIVGFVFGKWGTPIVPPVSREALGLISSIALFVILFTDGMHVHVREVREDVGLAIRSLVIGMPITALLISLFCRGVLTFSWIESLLIGAILAPTDPVFSAAIVGHPMVPLRLRKLLNIESGINDGLALPFVVVLLAVARHGEPHYLKLSVELLGGIGIGIVIPIIAMFLEKSKIFASSHRFAPLLVCAVGICVFGICGTTGANPYLAAFAAGITCRTAGVNLAKEFARFGDDLSELVKLLAVMLFSLEFGSFGIGVPYKLLLLGVLSAVIARPVAIRLALIPNRLPKNELFSAMWFGPKGFASITYGILVLGSGFAHSQKMFIAIASVVFISIILHSSTDTIIAKRFENGGLKE